MLYVLGGLAGSATHLAYCWYDAGGERCLLASTAFAQPTATVQHPQEPQFWLVIAYQIIWQLKANRAERTHHTTWFLDPVLCMRACVWLSHMIRLENMRICHQVMQA